MHYQLLRLGVVSGNSVKLELQCTGGDVRNIFALEERVQVISGQLKNAIGATRKIMEDGTLLLKPEDKRIAGR